MKKKVLIMAGYYIPSVKGGGPIQSIKNIIDNLCSVYDFYIVARDRDLGDETPFRDIETNKWIRSDNANVYYTDISKLSMKRMKLIIDSADCDVLYLNSYFSYRLTTIPLLLNKFKKIRFKKIIIAPRGEFSEGALSLKPTKKRVYINFTRITSLLKGTILHATAETEKKDILRTLGHSNEINVVNNLTADYENLVYKKKLKKNSGELNLIFLSRIHPKKNLKTAIEFLQELEGKINLDIYGPIEDKQYWDQCKISIKELPENINVIYHGVINHKDAINVFCKHHAFIFPTLGENFGHVISEALIGGCPVVISDQTPWRRLEYEGVGWDIELSNPEKYIQVLQYLVDISDDEFEKISRQAFEYGKLNSAKTETINSYIDLFDYCEVSN